MSAWEKTKHGSKAAFDKGWAAFEKLGAPVNKLTNKIGSEAFWPTGLGAESDKAARILKSFCKDGFYKEAPATQTTAGPTGTPVTADTSTSKPSSPGPKNKPKVLVKIPQKVIQNCVGLAIFSVMRTGLWVSGAGGSGVLIARKEDGNWGPPSGILIHTLGVGFMAGIDIYDCVIVINNRSALAAFSKLRVSLGGELSVVAGPLGTGGIYESELLKDRKPVFSYVKSRGLYGGLQIDGTVIVERNDENAKFYGERLPIGDIIAGHVKHVPRETHMLMEVLKQAEGRTDIDPVVLEQANHIPPPSDVEVEKMSEPTAEQKNTYAPPPRYSSQFGQGAEGYYPPEKNGPGVKEYEEGGPAYPPRPHHGSETGHGAGTPTTSVASSSQAAAHPPTDEKIPAYDNPQHQHDPSLYDPPTPAAATTSPFPLPLNTGKPLARTDSGFAPPPGPPPKRTDSGFPGPPPKSSLREV